MQWWYLVVAVANDEGVGEGELAHHHALLQRGHAALLQPLAAQHHCTAAVTQHHHRVGLDTHIHV